MEESSRYEIFVERAKRNIVAYREQLKGDGSFDYITQVKQLERLSSKMSGRMLTYLFGDQLGAHYAEKFVINCNRNLLYFLSQLTSEARLFILYELKNNEELFFYE